MKSLYRTSPPRLQELFLDRVLEVQRRGFTVLQSKHNSSYSMGNGGKKDQLAGQQTTQDRTGERAKARPLVGAFTSKLQETSRQAWRMGHHMKRMSSHETVGEVRQEKGSFCGLLRSAVRPSGGHPQKANNPMSEK